MEQDKNITNPFAQPTKSAYTPSTFLKTLRSYKGDVEEQIQSKHESVASIATKQQNIAHTPKPALAILTPKSGLFQEASRGISKEIPRGISSVFSSFSFTTLITILVLCLLGVGLLYESYALLSKPQTPVTVASVSIIPYTSEKTYTVQADARTTVVTSISDDMNSSHGSIGTVTYVRFLQGTTLLAPNDLFQALGPQAPSTLVRSFGGAYMSGVYSGISNEPFFILTSSDYGQTFAGMLAWEPSMVADLTPIFPQLTHAQSTWQDDTFNNQNVRVLRNDAGSVVLVYGFVNQHILIMATDEMIFQDLASKYINNQLVR